MTKEQLNKIDEEFDNLFSETDCYISQSLCCNGKDCCCNGLDLGHSIKNFIHSKLQEAYELGREEAYDFLTQQYEVSKRIEDRIRKDERERIIEIMNNLEAPDCIDDNCEYIHDGYFKALEDLTKSLQTK